METLTRAHYFYLQRRRSKSWTTIRYWAFMFTLNASVVPLWRYIYEQDVLLLVSIGVLIYLPQLLLTLRTLHIAVHVAGAGQSDQTLDLLALSGVKAYDFVYSRWLAVLRTVWKDYLLFALLRLGLAIGVAQFFHFVRNYNYPYSGLYNVMFYWSYNTYPEIMWPNVLQFLAATVTLLFFSLIEVAILSAIGITGFCLFKRTALRFMGAFLIRVALALIATALWQQLLWHTSVAGEYRYQLYEEGGYALGWEFMWISRGLKVMQLGVFTLADSGTMLAAQFMRVSGGFLGSAFHAMPSLIIACWSYASVISLCLFTARRLLIRRGFLP